MMEMMAVIAVIAVVANALIRAKSLSMRPAVVDDAPIVPVTWVCGNAAAPGQMTFKGENKTDIPNGYLPFNCRAPVLPQ